MRVIRSRKAWAGVFCSLLTIMMYGAIGRLPTHKVSDIGPQANIAALSNDEAAVAKLNHGGQATPEMRQHGWKLLEALLSPGQTPLWENWPTKCALDLSSVCDGATDRELNNPGFPGKSLQIENTNEKVIRLSSVFYSPDAARFIENEQLNTGLGLQKILLSGNDIPEFPYTSVIVKEIWQAISVNPDDVPDDVFREIPVYDPELDLPGPGGGLDDISNWHTFAQWKLKRDRHLDLGPCDQRSFDLLQDRVPIGCFYTKRLGGDCLGNQQRVAIVPTVPASVEPCYLILVGFQVMTREIKNWTWTTFWWTNNPDGRKSKDYFAGQPSQIDPRFQHYAMDTTFGPAPGQMGPLTPVFNPYLEGPRPNGTHSNCFSCHDQAAYVPKFRATLPGVFQHNTSVRTNADGSVPSPCLPETAGADRVGRSCPLKTALIFSLATNQQVGLEPFPLK